MAQDGTCGEKLVFVGDNLVSEAVTENVLLLEELSKHLDKESKVVKSWKHLAYALQIPLTEIEKIGFYSKHSPTEDLLDVLTDARDVKVGELKETLKEMHRNDVIKDLQEAAFTDDDCLLSELVSKDPKFVALLSSKLDVESIHNWKRLANHLRIEKKISNQFGSHGAGPTEALFLYIQTDEKLRCLTMGELHKYICDMGRNKLVNLLEKSGFKEDDTRLVRNEVVDGSDLLADIGKYLDIESRTVKNWRNLANKLEIPPDVYGAFDTSEAKVKSSTKEMFKWLAHQSPNLNVDDLLAALKKIGRFDLEDLVRKETNFAKKTFLKLQEMHRDADKHQKKGGLPNDLKTNASNKGFEIVYNDGKGNCMFHALCDQLKHKKHLEISHQDLRKDLVKYLQGHPKLSDGTELAGFIVTDRFPSWTEYLGKMAQDGTCGENLILFAAANCYKCDIHVISSVPNHDCTIRPVPPISDAVKLVLGHIVEEHYVSLRPSMSAEDREGQLQQSPSNFPQLGIHGQHQPETNGKEGCTLGSEAPSL